MWNEKYRPKTFDEMVGQADIVNYYRERKKRGLLIKNAIFRGRCGVGKTTLARLISNEFGVKIQEINGSDDRTLTYFRGIIKSMKNAPLWGNQRIIYVDETESMLKEAWMCLKTPMEKLERNSPIIFSCNDSSNIPDAIYSRCKVWDFSPISKADMEKRLRCIAEAEGIQNEIDVSDKVYEIIIEKAKGDLRKAVDIFEDYCNQLIQIGENEFEDLFVLH